VRVGDLGGWLTIDGSSDWWPLTPAQRDVDDMLILGPDSASMPTLLDPPTPTSNRSADAPRVPRRRPAPVNWTRLVIPAAIAAAGTSWYLAAVAVALMSFPSELFSS
jgi:hypothetical protein